MEKRAFIECVSALIEPFMTQVICTILFFDDDMFGAKFSFELYRET